MIDILGRYHRPGTWCLAAPPGMLDRAEMSFDLQICALCDLPLSDDEPTSPCSACRAQKVLAELPADVLARLDRALLTQHPLRGVMYVRVHHPALAVYEGLDIIRLRYAQLRESRPDDFTVSDAKYWVKEEG
jgi:hypothetical protein